MTGLFPMCRGSICRIWAAVKGGHRTQAGDRYHVHTSGIARAHDAIAFVADILHQALTQAFAGKRYAVTLFYPRVRREPS